MTTTITTAFRSLLFAAVLIQLACAQSGSESALHSTLDDMSAPTGISSQGALKGKRSGDSNLFLGIPYARPPIGDLRWQPPRDVAPWSGFVNATEMGRICPQFNFEDRDAFDPNSSEDCLTLNIAAPVGASDLPVLLSIHGGGFVAGSGQYMFENFPLINDEGVVLVTFNYRLGALGFFAHPLLPSTRGVNYGLMDMVAALRWVHRNISSFGGDPRKITIEGVSAGGKAVSMLMVNPRSEGLIAGAIAQSGYGAWPRQPRTSRVEPMPKAPSAEDIALELASRAAGKPGGSVTVPDLYALEPEQLVSAVKGFHLPIIDGITLPEETAIQFARGRQHPVPFISGGTSYEGSVFPWSGVSPDEILEITGNQTPRMRRIWAEDFDASEDQGISRFFGDLRYVYSAWNMTRNMRRVNQPGYLYLFDYVPPDQRSEMPGAGHGSDFMTMWWERELPTAIAMRGYWLNFVKTGDPNGDGLPLWPRVTADDATTWMVFGDSVVQQDDIRAVKMAFLDELWRVRVLALLGF